MTTGDCNLGDGSLGPVSKQIKSKEELELRRS